MNRSTRLGATVWQSVRSESCVEMRREVTASSFELARPLLTPSVGGGRQVANLGPGFAMIERIEYRPRKDVYNPGDVIYVAIYFRDRFIGQCEAGLVRAGIDPPGDFRRSTFARSDDRLYEGQVHVWEGLNGSCVLLIRLTPSRGAPQIAYGGDQIFEVRPIRP